VVRHASRVGGHFKIFNPMINRQSNHVENTMTETQMKEFLAVALQAATSARELILSYYNGEFDIEIKSDQTPVTVADRSAEKVIRKTIQEAFPDHGIFGEEYGAESKDTEYLWLVDPIDGTKSFVKRYGMFSTQIALMHNGELILGVSCAPAMDELVWATRGGGAFNAQGSLHISEVDAISQASISTGNIQSLAASKRWAVIIITTIDWRPDSWMRLSNLMSTFSTSPHFTSSSPKPEACLPISTARHPVWIHALY